MERSPWHLSNRADRRARVLADKHYSRKKIGARQFVPPGRCLVLYTEGAYWTTSWPFAEYVKHAWPGAWICSAFRREPHCPHKASDLIRLAIQHTRHEFGDAPEPHGMITFVDETKVKHKRDPGRCFLRAGFTKLEERTKEDNLLVFQMKGIDMPPSLPTGDDLFAGVA